MILAILQAQMSSTRLPGKVMMPLAGAPMIERQIERIVAADIGEAKGDQRPLIPVPTAGQGVSARRQ